MTLAQSLRGIREYLEEKGTQRQKDKLKMLSLKELDDMARWAQSMGIPSAISLYLWGF